MNIGYIIYGIPLSESASDLINEYEKDTTTDDWYETHEGVCGFTTVYHKASPYKIGWAGKVIDKINTSGPTNLESIATSAPTAEQRDLANITISSISEELRELCPDVGVYIVWGTD